LSVTLQEKEFAKTLPPHTVVQSKE